MSGTQSGTIDPCVISTITYTWSGNDICGNPLTPVTQTITVNPAPAPTIQNVPPAITINCDDALPALNDLTYDNGLTGTCQITGTVSGTQSGTIDPCVISTITNTWSGNDICGNPLTPVTQTITVNPAPAPTIQNVPPAITINCDDALPALNDLTYDNGLTGTCQITGTVSGTQSGTIDPCVISTITYTWSGNDICGNPLTPVTQTITVNPAPAPTIQNVPADVTIDCDDPLPALNDLTYDNGLTGTCQITGTVSGTQSGTIDPCVISTIIYTWSGNDICGNPLTPVTQTITVNPAPAPIFQNVPPAITINCDDALPALNDLTYDNGLTGTCQITGTVSGTQSGTIDPCVISTITYTWSGNDICGNPLTPVTQTITVNPAPAPTIQNVPADVTIDCDDPLPALNDLTYDNGLTGTCQITGTVSGTQSGTIDPCVISTITYTWSGNDICGIPLNPVTQTITVNPAPAPTIQNVPADVTIDCDDPLPALNDLTYDNNLTGTCQITGTVSGTQSGTIDPCIISTITYTWSGNDICGNPLTPVTQTIMVNPAPAPTIQNVPSAITINCDDALPALNDLTYDNGLTGTCQITGTVSGTQSGTIDPCAISTITYTWSGNDICGNPLTPVTQTITVNPAPAPTIQNVPADVTIDCDDPLPALNDLIYDNNITGTCQISGTVSGTQSGTIDPCVISTITYTWSGNDICGNPLTPVTQTITVNPAPAPTIQNVPADVTIDCDDPLPALNDLTYDNNLTGTCQITGTVSGTQSGTIDPCGISTITYTWSGNDICGNPLTPVTQTITVNPAPAPTIQNVPADVIIDCDDPLPALNDLTYDNNLTGTCQITGTVSGTQSGIIDPCVISTITYTWSGNDICGNPLIPVTQTITVNPAPAPTIQNVPPAITINCDDALPALNDLPYDNGLTGTCQITGTVSGVQSGTIDPCVISTITYTWSGNDICGNPLTPVTQTITVNPAPAPTIQNVPADVTIDCDDPLPALNDLTYDNNLTGTCQITGTVSGVQSGTIDPCGISTITYTWSGNDICGNPLTPVTQTITVNPAPAPTIQNVPADVTIDCDDPLPALNDLTYDNNLTGTCQITGTVSGTQSGTIDPCVNSTITYTWSGNDICGNPLTPVTQTITVNPAPTPTIQNVPPAITINCDDALPALNDLTYDNGLTGTCQITGTVSGTQSGTIDPCAISTITYTWSGNDICGNPLTPVTQTITVNPAPAPTIQNVPADVTIDCDDPLPALNDLTYDNNLTGTCQITGTVSGTQSGTIDPCVASTITYTWSGNDICGNPLTPVTQTITVNPAPAPTIQNVPPAITINCDDALPALNDLTYDNGLTGTCQITGTVSGTQSGTIDPCVISTITYTWSGNDICGNPLTPVTQTITVNPAPAPTIQNVPPAITINCDDALPALNDLTYDNGLTGTCQITGTVSGTQSGTIDPCVASTITYTWSGNDICGNPLTPVTQTITVNPAPAPTIQNVPADVTIDCDDPLPALNDLTYDNNLTGTCQITGTVSGTQSGTINPCVASTITYTWSGNDICGNPLTPVTQTITVNPAPAPTIQNVPSAITINCDDPLPALNDLTYDNGLTGTCQITGTVSGTQSGTIDPCVASTITYIWLGNDICGNPLAPVTQTITVNPAPAPTIQNVPTAVTIDCDDPLPALNDLTYDNNLTGTCQITGTVSGTQSGTIDPCVASTITYTWSGNDICGNPLTPVTQTITVNPAPTPTIQNVPADVTIDCDDPLPALNDLTYDNNLTGTCQITGTVSGTQSGTINPCVASTITYTWSGNDICGNPLTPVTQTITVNPAPAPTIQNVPADVTIDCDDPLPALNDLTYDNNLTGTCQITGVLSGVQIGTPDPCGNTITYEWSGNDVCGNSLSYTQNITINPAADPVFINPPADVNIPCGDPLPPLNDLPYDNMQAAPCNISGTVSGTMIDNGSTVTYQWEFTNACNNNTITHSQIITIDQGPDISTNDPMPVICVGDMFDLSSISIVDANNTGATITYHAATPATPGNVLGSTMVSPTTSTTYYVLATSSNGNCLDELEIIVTVNPTTTGEELYTGCQGDGYSITVNGIVYDETNPTGTETLTGANNCDSVVTVNLVYNTATTGEELYTGCESDGYSITVNGIVYDETNPTGTETLTGANNCDSVVTVNLVYNLATTGEELYTGCQGDGYSISVNGIVYDETNPTGTETLTGASGCDSIVTINLTYGAESTGTEDYTGCQGDGYSITVNGIVYDETNPTGTETLTSANNCDSVVTVNLVYNSATTGEELYTGCQGDGYSISVNGIVYDETNPTGTETLTSANNCDSVVTVNLVYNSATTGEELYTGCQGDGYSITVNGIVYDETNPTGTETLTGANNCDSVVTVNLVYNLATTGEELYTGCQGDGYSITVNGIVYDETNPTGTETLTGTNNCDSIVTINLTYGVESTGTEDYSGCEGDGYSITVNGIVYDETNPTGTETLTGANNCDSVVTVNLVYNSATTGEELYTGCQGDGYSITVNGIVYDETNPTGTETLTGANNCDSVVTVNLVYNSATTGEELYTGCQGDGYSITVNGIVYDETNPTGTETLTGVNNCDSVVTVNLVYNSATTGEELYTGCQGDGYSISVNGIVYDETNPTGTETLTGASGCDSIVTINLTYGVESTGTEDYTGCQGDGYSITVNGIVYDETNPTGTETLTSANNCDSVVTVNLVYNSATIGEELYTGCQGDGYSITVNGIVYDETNPTGTETLTGTNNCDSIVTINLTYGAESTGTELYTGCEGDGYSITVNGIVYDEANPTGTETLTGASGCDSIVTINLTYSAESTGTELYTGCEGDGYSITVNGIVYDEANPTGTETLMGASGCDSIVTINLAYGAESTGTELYTGCEGDGYSITVNGIVYDEANPTGTQTLTGASGCDSIVTINLTYGAESTGTEDYTGCEGDGYSVTVNGIVYDETNPTGTETLTSANNCDSVVTVNLVYNSATIGEELYTGCQGDGYSITVNGIVYDETNPTGTETLTGTNNCDSIVTINLTYGAESTGTELYTGCEGDGYSITVNGIVYDEANPTGTETLMGASGCDSIVTINLTYSAESTGTEDYTGCEGDGYSVTVNGIVYDEANPTGTETLMGASGCDSIVTINLTYGAESTGTELYTGCEGDGYSVTVNGIVYDETNPTGTETLTSANNCDSVVTVNLVYNSATTGEELYTGCQGDGYSITVNGIVYDETNPTGTETLMGASGCDSIVTINLTYGAESTGMEDYTGCEGDGYSVTVNGTLYNEANPTGTETLMGASGCDSIVTINLTYGAESTGMEDYTGCEGDGYSVTVNGTLYNEANPTGTEMLSGNSNCDSIVTINLVFNPPSTENELYAGCQGDGYSVTVNGTLYDETNPSGTEMMTDINNCDSIVVVDLVFNLSTTGTESYTGCEGDGYNVLVNGTLYFEDNPAGTETLTSANNCDSIVTINLTFSSASTGAESYAGCEGDGYSVTVNGTVYNEGNPVGSETLTGANGCDSVVVVNLTFSTSLMGSELYSGCQGDGYSVIVNGTTYDEANPTGTETLTSSTNCDSIVTIDLSFDLASTGTEDYTGCQGDGYVVTVNGTAYDESNPTGTETIAGNNNCDSVVTINLTYNAPSTGSEIYVGCEGDGYTVTVNGTLYYQDNPSGTEVLTGANNCDSIVAINLSYLPALTGNEDYAGCIGDGYSVVVNGTVYDETNPAGTEILTSSNNCDSIVTINLMFNNVLNGAEDYTGCQGDGYSVVVNGTVYNETNPTGMETLSSTTNCDSIVTINLLYNNTSSGEEIYTGCQGDGYSVTVNGNVYDEINPFGTETLTGPNGCDSIVSVNLAYQPPSSGIEAYIGCENDGYSVTVNGTLYYEDNPSGTEILTAFNNCDSVVTVDLVYLPVATGNEGYSGCIGDGYSVIVNGTLYDETNPSGIEILTGFNNCDSIVNINLSFSTSLTGTELYDGCQGDGYSVLVNGTIYDEFNPTGIETIPGNASCDSVVTIDLTFNATSTGDEVYDGCQGDGYSVTINGTVYDETNPFGQEILSGSNNCDSIVTVSLTFSPPSNGSELYIGCQGDGYSVVVNGNLYDEVNPSGVETMTNSLGCDSTVLVNLTFGSMTSGEELYDGCFNDGYSILVNGTLYDEANPTGTETLFNAAGCDSVVTIMLNFTDVLSGLEAYEGCTGDGYSVTVDGVVYDEANPSGLDTLLSSVGCDSIVTIDLIFMDSLFGTEEYIGCTGDGYSVIVNGTIYNEINPIGTESMISVDGCDSIVTISLDYIINTTTMESYTGCQGDGYAVLVNGVVYNQFNPSGQETLTSSVGCDSIVVVDLVFNPPSTGLETYDGCNNDGYSVFVNGTLYDQSNPNGLETLTGFNGCDSTVTINLTFNNDVTGEETYEGCLGDGYSVTVNGTVYDETNPSGTEILPSNIGCDSIVTIDLVYTVSPIGDEIYNGCENDGYSVIVNGTLYDETNPTGTEFIVLNSGCDSIVTVDLSYSPSTFGDEQYEGCEGDGYSVIVNGIVYDEGTPSGTQIIPNFQGCDSLVTIDLVFHQTTTGLETYEGCFNDGYAISVGGTVYDESNPTGEELLISSTGCDSIVTIDLFFSNEITGLESYTGCSGDGYSVLVNGTTYNETNPGGTEFMVSASGCDSIVTVDLVYENTAFGEESYSGCENDGYSVVVNGSIYDEDDPDGTEVMTAFNGCDSVVTVNLIFNPTTNGEVFYTGCEGDGYSVEVNGFVYDEATPSGLQLLPNYQGCDSIIIIELTFEPTNTGEEIYNGCFNDGYSVIVNGTVYDETNPVGTEVLTNTAGCDSIVSINLTFASELTGYENYEGCFGDGYNVTVNGTLYDETNPSGTEILPSSTGCDSIVTIDLQFNDVLSGEELYDGCTGDGYLVIVNGNLYNESNPMGTETLTSISGCDSIVTINLQYHPIVTGQELYSGCEGDGYNVLVNGIVYNEANPSGVETLTSSLGCDSIVTINLSYNEAFFADELYEGCLGDGYSITVNGTLYDENNPTGVEMLTTGAGCDSVVNIMLTFGESYFLEESYSGCENDGYTVLVNGVIYDESNPAGTEMMTTTSGCDSVVTIDLSFGEPTLNLITYDGCEGDGYSLTVNGEVYNESNPSGAQILTNFAGCDSLIFIELSFSPPNTGMETYSGCFNDGYNVVVNGTVYNETNPTGTETLTNALGCDSVVTINLTFNSEVTGTEDYVGCNGDGYSVIVNGTVYDESNPNGTETLTSTSGCDSIVTVNLLFNDALTGEESYTGCADDGYTVMVNGMVYDETNPMGMETLTSAGGCDSIVTVSLVFQPASTGEELYEGCEGDGYAILVNGVVYSESNPSGTEMLTSAAGCDSIVTINLTFGDGFNAEELYEGCEGDGYSVTVNGVVYDESNPTGVEMLTSVAGCDSVVTINLTFGDGFTAEELYEGCEGDGYSVTVNGVVYDESNPTGVEMLTSVAGCDSVVTISLTFGNEITADELYEGCEGDGYSVTVNGVVYDESNPTGVETLISVAGCDSVVTISLTFGNEITAQELYEGCEGDGYSVTVNGVVYDESNPTGVEMLTSVAGCDSVITISLTFGNEITADELYEGCEGDGYSVTVNGVVYDESNPTGVEMLTSVAGCDSVVTISLTFGNEITAEELYEGCEGDGYSVTVNGVVYDESNPTGVEMLTSVAGCDSVVTISLTFGNEITAEELYEGCEGDGYSVTVNGVVYDESNPTGVEMLTSVAGCDSVVTIILTFGNEITAEELYEGCEGDGYSVTVNGVVYDESNPTGVEMLTSVAGCDSVVTINLTFGDGFAAEELYEGCEGDGYSVMVNGVVYDESNPTGVEMLTSVAGCDSVVTINLTYGDGFMAEELYEGCEGDGYSVTVNGVVYDESNPIGIEQMVSVEGCDSVVVVNLTYNNTNTGTETYIGCEGDGYAISVNGVVYDESNPSGVEVLSNVVGCDSTVTISLNFLGEASSIVNPSLCFGQTVSVNGTVYDQNNPSGTEVLGGAAANGCDSVITVDLNFVSEIVFDLDDQICENESIAVNGTVYDINNPTGTETFVGGSVGGCDSIVNVSLDFNSLPEFILDPVLCFGDSLVINNTVYNETNASGMEVFAGGSILGCDSIVVVDLSFQDEVFFDLSPDLCPGEAVEVNGTTYDENTPTGTETIVGGSLLGCDSTISVNLNYYLPAEGLFDPTLCPGESVEVNGTVYDAANPGGVEVIAGGSVMGCDSTVTVDLSFEMAVVEDFEQVLCPGETIVVNGTAYDENNPVGTEIFQGGSYTGCDSTVNIALGFYPTSEQLVDPTLCFGESMIVNGTIYDASNPDGTEIFPGAAYTGCDSTVFISLGFTEEAVFDLMETLCEDDNITVNGTVYDLGNPTGVELIEGGNYQGCDSTVIVNLNFYPVVTAALTQDGFICAGDSIAITFLLGGGGVYDVWFSDGNTTTLLSGIVDGHTIMVAPGTTTTYSITNVAVVGIPCDPVLQASEVTIEVGQVDMTAEVTTDFSGFGVSCNGENNGSASAEGLNGEAPYFYQWSNGQAGSNVDQLAAGTYTVTTTDANGCTAVDQIMITEPAAPDLFVSATDPTCFGDTDGTIVIDTVVGGIGPYSYSVGGQLLTPVVEFPVVVAGLGAGNYDVVISDAYDCIAAANVQVVDPLPPAVELVASDLEIELGDSVRLDAFTNLTNFDFEWFTSELLSCDTCLTTYSWPLNTATYAIEMYDEDGCTAYDEITITVDKERNVFIPNAFSPNGDGVNDVFFVNTSDDVDEIQSMRIFDRWGEVVFIGEHIPANDLLYGWDGVFRDEPMNPAVFVYLIEVRFVDGYVGVYAGDLTLLR